MEDGLIVASSDGCRLFMMNGSARFVWERRTEGVVDADIPHLMAARYGIDPVRAERDFRDILLLWRDEGLTAEGGPRRAYRIAGAPFSIRFADAEVEAAIAPALAHLEDGDGAAGDRRRAFEIAHAEDAFELRADGVIVLRAASVDEIVERLVNAIVLFAYEKTPWLASLHAAAVGEGNACVLMPGLSGSGKSTLTAALVAEGLNYLTDDLVLLERERLRAVPVASPLVLKAGSWDALAGRLPALAASAVRRRLGEEARYWSPPRARVARAALPVAAVLFPHYKEGAEARMETLSAFDALSRIAAASCTVDAPITADTLARLTGWIRRTPAYALTYGALDDATAEVRRLLGAPA